MAGHFFDYGLSLLALFKNGGGFMSEQKYHQVLVPALDALIGNPELLSPDADTKKKADILAIPGHFIMRATELRGEQSSRGEACGELLRMFNIILRDIHYGHTHICANGMEIVFIEDKNITKVTQPNNKRGYEGNNSSKIETLKAARAYQGKLKEKQSLAILTGDNSMSSLAYAEGFDVAHINPEVYTGRRKVLMPEEVYIEWMAKGALTEEEFKSFFPKEKPLRINEFVEFEAAPGVPFGGGNYYAHIARFEPGNPPMLRRIHHFRKIEKIYPRNAGQAMLLEALAIDSDEVPIVICPGLFGTGKTFCTTVAGYYQTAEMSAGKNKYERIIVVPSEGSPSGRELGALPGSKDEKIAPMIAPIKDNLFNYFKSKKDKKSNGKPKTVADIKCDVENAIKQYFELEALMYIGGRSLTNCFIIYDEAQALERYQIKQLITRIGEGSKMVCMGDPGQVYNRHMNANSNGLSWVASKLAGNPGAIIVTLNPAEVERSQAAKMIAKCIG